VPGENRKATTEPVQLPPGRAEVQVALEEEETVMTLPAAMHTWHGGEAVE